MGTGVVHRPATRRVVATVLWVVGYVLASWLGRALVTGPQHYSVIWPAAGIALVWLATAPSRRQLMLDAILLGAATMGVLAVTSANALQLVLSLSAVLQTLVALWLLQRWVPGIWGTGGTRSLDRTAQFGLLLAAVGIGALTTAVLRTVLGVIAIPEETWSMVVGRWGRNAAAMATIGTFGLLLGGWAAERRAARRPLVGRVTAADVGHLIGIEGLTAAIFVLGYGFRPGAPTTYLLTLTAVWVALRFPPVVVALQALGTGAVAVGLTLAGIGPIATIADPETRALYAMLLVVVLMVTGMAISLSRKQTLDSVEEVERSRAEVSLRAHELDLVMAHLNDGVAIVERGGRIVHANEAMRTGLRTQERNDLDRVPEEETPEEERLRRGVDGLVMTDALNPLYRAMDGELVEGEEWRSPVADGPIRWVEISGIPLPREYGGQERAMIVVRDISANKEHAEQLAKRAEELDLMLSRLTNGVAIVEEGGRYVQSNDALRDIMIGNHDNDYFKGDVPPPATYHIHHPDGRPIEPHEYPYIRALAGEDVDGAEFHIRRPGITAQQVVKISSFTLDTLPGERRRAMVVVRDITAEKAYQDSLVGFASTVAHDLNTPLSVIDGWAEAIQEDLAESDDPVAVGAVAMVQHLRGGVDQMREFVRDLLAHAVARDQTLRCEPLSLRRMVKHIKSTRDRPGITDGGIETGDLLDVWADRLLVRQVLDNLIGNGLKYVAPGTAPRVVVSSHALPGDWVEVSVRDNGIGIPESERELVFDSFHRAKTAGYAGTGLGLAICKRIVERHGGTIRIEANPEGGSCFVFTLPGTVEAFTEAARRAHDA